MAGETLRDASGLLANFPDNTAGLIEAVHSRDFVVSSVPAIGFMEDDQVSFNIDVTAAWTSINQDVVPAPITATNFWKLDGNNSWLPSYTDIGVIVPAGVLRLVGGNTTMIVEKVGGGSDAYEFAFFSGGVQLSVNPATWTISAPTLVVISEEFLYEPALSLPIELRVRGAGGVAADDLTCLDFRQRLTSVML